MSLLKDILGFSPMAVPKFGGEVEKNRKKGSSQKRQAGAFRVNVSAKLSKSLTEGCHFRNCEIAEERKACDGAADPWL